MQCAILAGGLATRMRPLTDTVPKAMLEVAGQPFAHWQLTWLAEQGVTDVVYCVAHLGEQIRHFVGAGARWNLRVRYADEGPRLRGTAGALADAARAGLLGEDFLVLYGDSYLDIDVRAVWRAYLTDGRPMLMTVLRNDEQLERSNVRFEHGRLLRYDKGAPDPLALGMEHVDYGLSVIHRAVLLELVPPAATPSDLATVQQLLSASGRVTGFEAQHRFYEVGTPAGLQALHQHLTTRS